ncbi:hypothetical protein F5146DRAFT_379785 [Armillaria mellea]|nr:hypothetical protein F5146DRAFT_379785 [Armillaria mellea]
MSPLSSWDIPADVFYEILLKYGMQNISFLWLNYRPVCRNFKDAVKRVFATKDLRRTWLHIDTGELETDIELQFYALDPTDSTHAVFESYNYEDYLERTLRNGPCLQFPNVIIQIRHDANDTMLPNFRCHLDPNKFEVSFDWKGMYSHFFREQKEAQTRFDECYRSIAERHMSTASEAERVVMMELLHGFRRMASALDHIRIVRIVRSERIRRNARV